MSSLRDRVASLRALCSSSDPPTRHPQKEDDERDPLALDSFNRMQRTLEIPSLPLPLPPSLPPPLPLALPVSSSSRGLDRGPMELDDRKTSNGVEESTQQQQRETERNGERERGGIEDRLRLFFASKAVSVERDAVTGKLVARLRVPKSSLQVGATEGDDGSKRASGAVEKRRGERRAQSAPRITSSRSDVRKRESSMSHTHAHSNRHVRSKDSHSHASSGTGGHLAPPPPGVPVFGSSSPRFHHVHVLGPNRDSSKMSPLSPPRVLRTDRRSKSVAPSFRHRGRLSQMLLESDFQAIEEDEKSGELDHMSHSSVSKLAPPDSSDVSTMFHRTLDQQWSAMTQEFANSPFARLREILSHSERRRHRFLQSHNLSENDEISDRIIRFDDTDEPGGYPSDEAFDTEAVQLRKQYLEITALLLRAYPRFAGLLRRRRENATLRQRPIAWILRIIDSVYTARQEFEHEEKQKKMYLENQLNILHERGIFSDDMYLEAKSLENRGAQSAGDISFTLFLFSFLVFKHGLPALGEQFCWDTVLSVQEYRSQYLEVELFARFLDGTYSSSDLLFFLHAREQAFRFASQLGMIDFDVIGGDASRSSLESVTSPLSIRGKNRRGRESNMNPLIFRYDECIDLAKVVFENIPDAKESFEYFFENIVREKYFDLNRSLEDQELEMHRFLFLLLYHFRNTSVDSVPSVDSPRDVQYEDDGKMENDQHVEIQTSLGVQHSTEVNKEPQRSSPPLSSIHSASQSHGLPVSRLRRVASSSDSDISMFAATYPRFYEMWMDCLELESHRYVNALLRPIRQPRSRLSAISIESERIIRRQLEPILEGRLVDMVRDVIHNFFSAQSSMSAGAGAFHLHVGKNELETFSKVSESISYNQPKKSSQGIAPVDWRSLCSAVTVNLHDLLTVWYETSVVRSDGDLNNSSMLSRMESFSRLFLSAEPLRHEVEPLCAYFMIVALKPHAADVCLQPFFSMPFHPTSLIDPSSDPSSPSPRISVSPFDASEIRSDASELDG